MTVVKEDVARGAATTEARRAPVLVTPRCVFLDLEAVLLAEHRGPRGVELGVQADIAHGVERLAQVADWIVILAYPTSRSPRRASDDERLRVLSSELGHGMDDLLVVACPHEDGACDCAKPGSGLIELAMADHHLPHHHGWFIGGDQEGVVSARSAGLSTVRIGPQPTDHLSSVHRPDYEARDLLDAANHILMEELI